MAKKRNLLILCIIMAFCISVCILYKPIYYRLYFGDRIKGNVKVEIDDKPYFLEENKIKFHDSGKIEVCDDGTADISFHAGGYGGYLFEILDTPTGSPIAINCFQHNWWSVQNFELTIKIDTSQNMITYSGNCTTVSDDGQKIYDPIDITQSLTDKHLQISLGL